MELIKHEAFMYYYELPGKMFLKYRGLKIVEFWDVKPSSSVDRYTRVENFDIPTKTRLYFPEGIIWIYPAVTISNLITQYLLTQIYSVQ